MALKVLFGNLCADFIHESGRTIDRVADEIGRTPPNQFSKWKAGRWTYIAESKLVRVIDVVARKDQAKRTALMIAYLIDLTPEVFRHAIEIRPVGGGKGDLDKPGLGDKWSPSMRERLEDLGRAYSRDPVFMEHMDLLGRMAKKINARSLTSSGH